MVDRSPAASDIGGHQAVGSGKWANAKQGRAVIGEPAMYEDDRISVSDLEGKETCSVCFEPNFSSFGTMGRGFNILDAHRRSPMAARGQPLSHDGLNP
jgi:hypothetical protein